MAPFQRGQAVGTLRISLEGQATEVPLLALEAVDEAGLIGRAWDAMRLWIQ